MEQGKLIVQGKDIAFNRIKLEDKKTGMLILSHTGKQDNFKQRDSGLNHVLCNLARDNDIVFGIDFLEILEVQGKERGEVLARIMQNIKLMKKSGNKVKMINKSGRENLDLRAFLTSLGMRNDDAKDAVEN